MNYLLPGLAVAALSLSYLLGHTPLFIPALYMLMSLIAFAAYAKDKSAAQRGAWRVSENTLHVLALLGGWPGAALAQHRLRHKTSKLRFRLGFWLTVCVNGTAFVLLHTSQGAARLNSVTFGLEDFIRNEADSDTLRTLLLYLMAFHV